MTAVEALKGQFGIAPILTVLGVAASTYYGWLAQQRDPSQRRRADTELLDQIREIHDRSGATYGAPRVHATLRRRGRHVSRKRVERLMREHGLQGAFLRKRWRAASTRQDPRHTPAPDLVNRDFTASAPTGCGSPTPHASPAGRACSGWPRSATRSPTGSSGGAAQIVATLTSSSARSSMRSGLVMSAQTRSSITRIAARITRLCASGNA
nr:IS3 family transposase [Pseudonocardia sp. N23]